MTKTLLDNEIADALQQLGSVSSKGEFDYQKYISAFRESAQKKAAATLEELNSKERSPFWASKPVFVSIGGGDGEEIINLLQNSNAQHGILIELTRPLAEQARKRGYEVAPKSLRVFEGEAQALIGDAMAEAASIVKKGEGDLIAVTCHAVLHELFDRGKEQFDPLNFFGSIFATDIPTWFTYREPGAPEKWPDKVLLQANCSPHSLLSLAEVICRRHASLRQLTPKAVVVGDHVQLHKNLAMEVLAKLFYLTDLEHEIEERSTSVEHTLLGNSIWLAIGKSAQEEGRANSYSTSSPTDAFVKLWQRYGIQVLGLDQKGMTLHLPTPESQTRLVAWRRPSEQATASHAALLEKQTELTRADLLITQDALDRSDAIVLTAMVKSKGRAWIESSSASEALKLLGLIKDSVPPAHEAFLWSHLNICLAQLFRGDQVSPDWFSPELENYAKAYGIDLLYRGERMEFARRSSRLPQALEMANQIFPQLTAELNSDSNPTTRYVEGAVRFLIGNLLRHGGQYGMAWEYIDRAQKWYLPGQPAHDIELAHCYYAKQICIALTGKSGFDAPFGDSADSNAKRFANALVTLSYSHSAWFMGDVALAKNMAIDAASRFSAIGYKTYSARAQNLGRLLEIWKSLAEGRPPDYSYMDPKLAKIIQLLTGQIKDSKWLCSNFRNLRPSAAVGLLQIARQFGKGAIIEDKLQIPDTLDFAAEGSLVWKNGEQVGSLEKADELLRSLLSIPQDRTVPLIAH